MASLHDQVSGIESGYQPLTLGPCPPRQPLVQGPRARKSASRSGPPHYEAWREKITQTGDVQLETQPEDLVLDELRREAARASWVQPILGEPGASEAGFYAEWASRLAANPAYNNTPFALIPLRRFVASDCSLVGGAFGRLCWASLPRRLAQFGLRVRLGRDRPPPGSGFSMGSTNSRKMRGNPASETP